MLIARFKIVLVIFMVIFTTNCTFLQERTTTTSLKAASGYGLTESYWGYLAGTGEATIYDSDADYVKAKKKRNSGPLSYT